MDCAAKFEQGLPYDDFLARYATEEHRRRWEAVFEAVELTDGQKQLLRGFQREMKVLVLAGTWCGDCIDQCPIFERFASQNERICIRYLDRDDHADLQQALSLCGGKRVPVLVFLSEDDHLCGWHGDRTLSKYRHMAAEQLGAACPSGLVRPDQSLLGRVTQEWLDEFERIQLMLRTSGRLRKRHGD